MKRVSDINAMGAPAQPAPQPFNPYQPPFPTNTEFRPNMSQPIYGEYQPPPYSGPAGAENFPNAASTVPMQQTQYSMLAQPVVQDMAFQYGQQVKNLTASSFADIYFVFLVGEPRKTVS